MNSVYKLHHGKMFSATLDEHATCVSVRLNQVTGVSRCTGEEDPFMSWVYTAMLNRHATGVLTKYTLLSDLLPSWDPKYVPCDAR